MWMTKWISFNRFVIDERKLCACAMSEIGNMDETPMYFDMPGNTSVDFVGNKTIIIKTTGHEKQHLTVVLACLADGTKVKPMVIFKRKTMPKDKFPSGVLVKVQEKGWMNEGSTHTWLDEIWSKQSGSLLKPTSLLEWHQFRAHLCESVKKKLHRNKTRQAINPRRVHGNKTRLAVNPRRVQRNKTRQAVISGGCTGIRPDRPLSQEGAPE